MRVYIISGVSSLGTTFAVNNGIHFGVFVGITTALAFACGIALGCLVVKP